MKDKKPPFDLLKFDNKKKGFNFLQAVKEVRNNMEGLIEMMKLEAEFKKKRYDYLVENGFTKEQAIELCKKNCFLD